MRSIDENRREFLKEAGATLGATVFFGTLGSTLESCATGLRTPNTAPYIDVDVSGLQSDDQTLIASDPGPDGAGVLIHRESSGRYAAYSMKCRHKGCNIGSPDAQNVMTCPCHGSQYDTHGKLLQGPATENLRNYPTRYDAVGKKVRVDFKQS
jgi:Rieske Fe-S protein